MNIAHWELEHVSRYGDLHGLIVDDRTWTNHQLYDEACRLATAFQELGVRPGDRVAIALPNCRELFVAHSASLIAGAVVVVLGDLGDDEIDRMLKHCEPTVVVTGSRIASRGPKVKRLVVVSEECASAGWSGFDELVRNCAPCVEPIKRADTDPAQLCYTGGTTSSLRAVCFTHGRISAFWRYGSAAANRSNEPSTLLLAIPPTAFGSRLIGLRVVSNATYVALRRFEPEDVFVAIERWRVTAMPLVPIMAEQLVASHAARKHDCSSLRVINIAGAHVSGALIERLRTTLSQASSKSRVHVGGDEKPPLTIAVHYGMTETGGGFARTSTGGDGVVGLPCEGVIVRVVNEFGEPVPPGVVGEVIVKAPFAGESYWRDAARTATVFRDGFVHTGDLGLFGAEGELRLVGRMKDIIVQGAHKVVPQEVEQCICEIDGIVNCAVVGVQDDFLGEEVVACVVRSQSAGVTRSAILLHCRKRLDPRKLPARLIFMDALPLTRTGKVDVNSLRVRLASSNPSDRGKASHAVGLTNRLAVTKRTLRDVISDVLDACVADRGSAELAEDVTFGDMGLDSIGAVWLAHALSEALAEPFSPALVYTYPTLKALSDFLSSRDTANSPLFVRGPKGPATVAKAHAVAIVGIGCRLPGGVSGPADLWDLMCRGVDVTSSAPRFRCRPETANWRAAFLAEIDLFDAEFFRLGLEAAELDPRHRMLLEVSWEALEDSGHDPLTVTNRHTVGVFVGIYGQRYASPSHLGTSNGMAAARLCHFLDFRGPVLSVDTTCSSALVALHCAAESLRKHECDVAVVAAANLLSTPPTDATDGLMSRDGYCKAFDLDAAGFGQGEGCIVVVLKRVADADVQGDRVYATIEGSAINHDGRSASLTAPNGLAQTEVIRLALRAASLAADNVQYVEAHGTGTPLGDPIEVEALERAFGPRGSQLLRIGSVKSNLGHLEAAAGLAGIAKVALAIWHRWLPATVLFSGASHRIPWQDLSIRLQSESGPWPDAATTLVAGVSSFGMSGTNAHAILREHRHPAPPSPDSGKRPDNGHWIVPISAKTESSLQAMVLRYIAAMEDAEARVFLRDLAYTASCRRAHLEHRLTVAGSTLADCSRELRSYLDGRGGSAVKGKAEPSRSKLAMVFAGQGTQWWSMGRELMSREPAFRAGLENCAKAIDAHVRWRLLDQFSCDEQSSQIATTDVAQPMIFALQVALYELWRSWGVEPAVVVGHSLGEIAAAHAAGALSLEQAAWLVCERGRIMAKTAGAGAMAVVSMSAPELETFIGEKQEYVDIAATNDVRSTVLSGDSAVLSTILESLNTSGVATKWLNATYAFHSRKLGVVYDELIDRLAGLEPSVPRISMVSTFAPKTLSTMNSQYWGRQMCGRVRFLEAVHAMLDDGCTLFLEIGPHPALVKSVQRTVNDRGVAAKAFASLRRDAEGVALARAFCELYCSGYPVDWAAKFPEGGNMVAVPTYAWQHDSHWYSNTDGAGQPNSGLA